MNASIHDNETSKITNCLSFWGEAKTKKNVSQSFHDDDDDDGQTVTLKKSPRGNMESFSVHMIVPQWFHWVTLRLQSWLISLKRLPIETRCQSFTTYMIFREENTTKEKNDCLNVHIESIQN